MRGITTGLLAAAALLLLASPAAADQIAFTRGGSPPTVMVLDTATGTTRAVRPGDSPSWGPGAGRLVMVRDADPGASGKVITSTAADGTCVEDLVGPAAGLAQPALSDDALRLLYVAPSGFGPLVHLRDLATGIDRVVAAGTSPVWTGGSSPQSFSFLRGGTVWQGDVNSDAVHPVATGIVGAATFDGSAPPVVADDTGVAVRQQAGRQPLAPSGRNPSVLATSPFVPTVFFDDVVEGRHQLRSVPLHGGDITPVATSPAADDQDPDAAPPAATSGDGYRMVAGDGGVFDFGHDCFAGSTGSLRLNQPVVGMAETPSGAGYWLVARDGGIFSFGDASFHGSTGDISLNRPIVGMAATPSGGGYWLVAGDGGVFTFGDAGFAGSAVGRLGSPAVALVSTPSGRGYWIVGAGGDVIPFGDAARLAFTSRSIAPFVGAAGTPDGTGLWLLSGDGGVFTAGSAPYAGAYTAPGATGTDRTPFVGMRATTTGRGYWLFSAAGGVYSYGDATYFGSLGGVRLNRPIVGA